MDRGSTFVLEAFWAKERRRVDNTTHHDAHHHRKFHHKSAQILYPRVSLHPRPSFGVNLQRP